MFGHIWNEEVLKEKLYEKENMIYKRKRILIDPEPAAKMKQLKSFLQIQARSLN